MKSIIIDAERLIGYPGSEYKFSMSINLDPVLIGGQKVNFLPSSILKGCIRNVGNGILLQARLNFSVTLVCSRCLEKFSRSLNSNIDQLYVFPEKQEGVFEEQLYLTNNQIEISGAITESAILEIPFNPICQDNCAGLCPTCGKNKNLYPHNCEVKTVDSRMKILERYFK
jgi:uncharacterized protein